MVVAIDKFLGHRSLKATKVARRRPRKRDEASALDALSIAKKARQMLSWQTYLKDVRSLLSEVYNQDPSTSFRTGLSEKLLAPQADVRNRMHHQLKRLSEQVKDQLAEKLDVKIKELSQLR